MPNGILLLDKPRGLTSNGALQRVRKAFGAKSAGHVGTLDPMATGMLPICLDEATKVISEIESGAKAYEFTVKLGERTDTGDVEGEVVERLPVPELSETAIEATLSAFRGIQSQIPPMYSALKRAGRPLYELARQGIEVERPPRQIEIRELVMVGHTPEELRLRCECTKGTYIRVLGEDIARKLGTTGHLVELRRTWVEPFRDMPMYSLEAAVAGGPDLSGLLSMDVALGALPYVGLSAAMTEAVRHGQAVRYGASAPPGGRVRLYDPDGRFVGLAEGLPDGRLQPRRLLQTN